MKTKKFISAIISLLLAVCIAIPMAACGTETLSASMVELDRSTLTLNIGEEETLSYTVFPEEVADDGAQWISSVPSVASVKDGKVTAKAAGKAGIRVTVGGMSAVCTVTVVDPSKVQIPANGIELSRNTLELNINGTERLTATVKPENVTDSSVTWTSSAPDIAMVGTNGLVSGLADGTAVITAQTHNGIQATCVVTVGSGVSQQSGGLYVGQVTSLKGREPGSEHPFIMAMDSSELISVEKAREASDASYFKDFDGNEVEDVLTVLKKYGITDIRIRVWNDPTTGGSNARSYGGGNCDVQNAVDLSKRCAAAGLGVIIDFHYSDFWADPSKYKVPKAWEDMDLDTKANALEQFTSESLTKIAATGVKITMVQIGNETTTGLAGETDWTNICKLMNAGAKAIRAKAPGAKIAVHFTDAGNGTYDGYASDLKEGNVDYDVFGTSWYPYYKSHGSLQSLASTLTSIHNTYHKEVMVLETAYAFTYADADGGGNTPLETTTQPVTVQGMANAVRDVIQAIADLGDWGLGVSYWGGTWIAASESSVWADNAQLCEEYGCGWANDAAYPYDPGARNGGGGTMVDNNAFFLSDGTPIEALKVFRDVYEGHTTDLAADYLETQEVYYTINEGPIELPSSVDIVLNNGSKQTVPAIWSVEQSKLAEYISEANMYEVKGTTKYGGTCICNVWVMNVNLFSDPSFENLQAYGDSTEKFIQGALGKWNLSYTDKGAGELQLFVSNNTGNARMGSHSFHFWDSSAVYFDLSQTFTAEDLATYGSGNYGCSFDFQGADGASPQIYSYIEITYKDGSKEKKLTKGSNAVMNGWQWWSRTAVTGCYIDLTQVASVTVGIHVEAEMSGKGPWGNIDNCNFYFED